VTPRAVVKPVSDVMSELAPLAAAPKLDLAPDAVDVPVPPLAMATVPERLPAETPVNPDADPLKEVAVTVPLAVRSPVNDTKLLPSMLGLDVGLIIVATDKLLLEPTVTLPLKVKTPETETSDEKVFTPLNVFPVLSEAPPRFDNAPEAVVAPVPP